MTALTNPWGLSILKSLGRKRFSLWDKRLRSFQVSRGTSELAKRKATKKSAAPVRKGASSKRTSVRRASEARQSGDGQASSSRASAGKPAGGRRSTLSPSAGLTGSTPPRHAAEPNGDRPRSRLSTADLQEFRDLLIEKRKELVGDMAHLHNEAFRQGGSGDGGGSHMPIHMADIGSDTWEQELTLGLMENERSLLREIDEALDRIDNKTYGICLATNKVITKARLRAKPWAKYCIEHARKLEQGRY